MAEIKDGRHVFALLGGLKEIPRGEISFPNGVSICCALDIVKWKIAVSNFFDMNLAPPHCLRYFEPLTRTEITVSLTDQKRHEIASKFDAVLRLLRLFKPGKLDYQLIISLKIFRHDNSYLTLLEFFRYGTTIPVLNLDYSIYQRELDDLLTFSGRYYEKLLHSNQLKDKNLNLTLMRFDHVTLWTDACMPHYFS